MDATAPVASGQLDGLESCVEVGVEDWISREDGGDVHDRLLVLGKDLADVDVLMLAQFSMVRARDGIADIPGRAVLTAPDEAVLRLKGLLGG